MEQINNIIIWDVQIRLLKKSHPAKKRTKINVKIFTASFTPPNDKIKPISPRWQNLLKSIITIILSMNLRKNLVKWLKQNHTSFTILSLLVSSMLIKCLRQHRQIHRHITKLYFVGSFAVESKPDFSHLKIRIWYLNVWIFSHNTSSFFSRTRKFTIPWYL